MKLTNEEKLLKYLINEYQNSATNKVCIYQSAVSEIDMNEKDVIRAIYTLEADQKLVINTKSQQENFGMPWRVTLTSSGIYHFNNKKEKQKEKRSQRLQFIIPVIISIVGAIASVLTAYFTALGMF